MAREPTNADLARRRWCYNHGHEWPPVRECRPGDEHWCGYCGTRRVILPDGRAWYEVPWA